MTPPTCNTELLREIFARGLTAGLGTVDGQTCIEGAISLACGGDLSDSPPCVAAPDRTYSIAINDASWPSPEARAEALLPLALAQVGTAGTDRIAWVQALALGTVQRVLPIALRAAGLTEHADRCAAVKDLAAARVAAEDAAEDAARDAAWDAAGDAEDAAWAAAWAVARDARAVAWAARVVAEDAAGDAAHAAARAAGDAALRESVAVALDAYRAEGRA